MVGGAGCRSGVGAAMGGLPPRHVLTACLDSLAVGFHQLARGSAPVVAGHGVPEILPGGLGNSVPLVNSVGQGTAEREERLIGIVDRAIPDTQRLPARCDGCALFVGTDPDSSLAACSRTPGQELR